MKTYWTAELKPQVLKTLAEANITGEASKHILKFEKTINTLWGLYINGASWEFIWNTDQSLKANELIESLNGNGIAVWMEEKPKYWEEWKKYCDVKGTCYDASLSDCLA